jgi:DNA-binding CsgD family transcriptional regulator
MITIEYIGEPRQFEINEPPEFFDRYDILSKIDLLTIEEYSILEMLGCGNTIKQISTELICSEAQVNSVIASIRLKLALPERMRMHSFARSLYEYGMFTRFREITRENNCKRLREVITDLRKELLTFADSETIEISKKYLELKNHFFEISKRLEDKDFDLEWMNFLSLSECQLKIVLYRFWQLLSPISVASKMGVKANSITGSYSKRIRKNLKVCTEVEVQQFLYSIAPPKLKEGELSFEGLIEDLDEEMKSVVEYLGKGYSIAKISNLYGMIRSRKKILEDCTAFLKQNSISKIEIVRLFAIKQNQCN